MAIFYGKTQADGQARMQPVSSAQVIPQHPVASHDVLHFIASGQEREQLNVLFTNGDLVKADGVDIEPVLAHLVH